MGVSYNRNAGLALDAELALLVADAELALLFVDANVSIRMRICSNPHLK